MKITGNMYSFFINSDVRNDFSPYLPLWQSSGLFNQPIYLDNNISYSDANGFANYDTEFHGDNLSLGTIGNDITGTVKQIINYYSDDLSSDQIEQGRIEGASFSLAEFITVAITSSKDDDAAFTKKMLAGNDDISATGTIHGYGGNDIIHGHGTKVGTYPATIIWGDGGDDQLFGEASSQSLIGGNGDDLLTGGGGRDYLRGGSGTDTYAYEARTDFGDFIYAAEVTDRFSFKGAALGGLAAGAIDSAIFIAGTTNAALDSGDRFIFRTTDHTLWFDSDGIGGTKPIMVAHIINDVTLTDANILIV